jgi:hypothetical protein
MPKLSDIKASVLKFSWDYNNLGTGFCANICLGLRKDSRHRAGEPKTGAQWEKWRDLLQPNGQDDRMTTPQEVALGKQSAVSSQFLTFPFSRPQPVIGGKQFLHPLIYRLDLLIAGTGSRSNTMKVRMKWRMFLPTRNHSYLHWSLYLFFIIGILALGYAGKPRHSRIFRIASRGWISIYNPYPTATAEYSNTSIAKTRCCPLLLLYCRSKNPLV